MNEADSVCLDEHVGDVPDDANHALLCKQGKVLVDNVAQRNARQHLHRQVDVALRLAEVVDVDGVGMIQRGCHACLTLEALNRTLLYGVLRVKHLERDLAAEVQLRCAIHLTHPACAEKHLNPILSGEH